MTRPAPGPAASAPVATGPSHVVECRVVADAAEAAEHHRIRRTVFVEEQQIFTGSDLDAHDARGDVLHVLAWVDGRAVGTVRLFLLDAASGTWQGDRLAVLHDHRALCAGAPLVRFAVAEAGARGGTSMIAHVQVPNQRFFERLGWTAGAVESYAGRPHIAMTTALSRATQASRTATSTW